MIFAGTHQNETSKLAKILIPTLTSFEKTGCFINRNFRVQSFKQAIPGPAGLLPDLQILSALIKSLEKDGIHGPDLSSIWKEKATRRLPLHIGHKKILPAEEIIIITVLPYNNNI